MAQSEHVTEAQATIEDFLKPEVIEMIDQLEAEWEARILGLSGPVALWAGDGGDDGGDDDSDDDDGSQDDADGGDDDGDDDGDEEDPVKKAYTKLREAEARERQKDAELKRLQRKGLDAAARAEAERDDARAEAAALQERLDEIEQGSTVVEVAKGLKFKNPDGAKRFIKGKMDEKAIRSELKSVLKDFPELAQEGTPPPPVNDGNKDSAKGNNQRMNETIRKAAGRG